MSGTSLAAQASTRDDCGTRRARSVHIPREDLIDLDVRVTNRHELDLHLSNDTLGNEGPKVAEQYVVLVLGYAVVDLDREVTYVWSRPGRNVQLEQPMQDLVKRGADQVATCVADVHDKSSGRVD